MNASQRPGTAERRKIGDFCIQHIDALQRQVFDARETFQIRP